MQHFNFQALPVHVRHDLNATLYANQGAETQIQGVGGGVGWETVTISPVISLK